MAEIALFYSPFFRICTQIYFLVFGAIILRYALKSRNNEKKINHPEYFKNEVLIGLMFMLLAGFYPLIFENVAATAYSVQEMYFHVWDSLTVQIIGWQIYYFWAQKKNQKHNRTIESETWKDMIREKYKKTDAVKSDIMRKLMHLIPPSLVIGTHYLGKMIDGWGLFAGTDWTALSFGLFASISFGFTFLFLMAINDYSRLNFFHKLGKFAREWNEKQIHPDELETFTSANLMMLSFIPFYIIPYQITFDIVVIAAVSDAAASLVGKRFGKKRNGVLKKTREGFAAGFMATYLVVIVMNEIFPIPNAQPWLIHLMAILAGLGFLLTDLFAEQITDNFLNAIVTGIILWATWFLAQSIETGDWTWLGNPFFMYCVMVYFVIFGIINIQYANKSRHRPEKAGRANYWKNEFLVGSLFIVLAVIYPFIFDSVLTSADTAIRNQTYFHIWDSLTVHVLVWQIATKIWRRNNIKKNRVMTSEEWKARLVEIHDSTSDLFRDFKRKLMHFITAGLVVVLYVLTYSLRNFLSTEYSLNWQTAAVIIQFVLGLHVLWTMNIADHLRLQKFEMLGKFARDWQEDAMKPSELETLTSANPMMLTWLIFALFGPSFLVAVCLVAEISDAMASIVGKSIGKMRTKSSKTIEGYIAGSLSTFVIIIGTHALMPFPGASWGIALAMAIAGSVIFLFVDMWAKVLSDNFYNGFFIGIILWIVYTSLI